MEEFDFIQFLYDYISTTKIYIRFTKNLLDLVNLRTENMTSELNLKALHRIPINLLLYTARPL